MKHDWKKNDKHFYLPKGKPESIVLPEFRFFTLKGAGNPNDAFFAEYIGVLYSLSYAVKMSRRQGIAPEGYYEYSVFPLEGVWDIKEEARAAYQGRIDKDTLVFTLMIRQPDFVTPYFAQSILNHVAAKKPHPLLSEVQFESITEGPCVQMLHTGSYDSEPASFAAMEAFAEAEGLVRSSKLHREIYLSDARRVAPEKLKTVLRFQTL